MPDERSIVTQHEELQPLLERADASGVVEAVELREALELLDLDPGDVEALHKELEERGIEVVDRQKEPAAPLPGTEVLETTTDALQLFLREIGRHPLLTAADEVVKSGYKIVMEGTEVMDPVLTCTGDTPVEGYHVTADPVTPGTSGIRFFGTNVDLVIYENLETFSGKMPDNGAPPIGQEAKGMTR